MYVCVGDGGTAMLLEHPSFVVPPSALAAAFSFYRSVSSVSLICACACSCMWVFYVSTQACAKYPELNGDAFIQRVIDGDADAVGEMILAGIDTNVKRSTVIDKYKQQ